MGVALQEARVVGVFAPVTVTDLTDARDRALLERISDRDEDAFRELFERYAPTAQALAARLLREGTLAQEVVQEGFLSVWQMPDRFDGSRGSVRAWIMTQVHHRAVDLVRREESQRRRATGLAAEPGSVVEDPAVTVVEEIGLPQERDAVRRALSRLPDEQRVVLELMYFGGRTQREVAEQSGVPLGTIKSRTLLGMRKLREALAEIHT